MVFPVLADLPTVEPAQLALECRGEYEDLEKSTGQSRVRDADGNWKMGNVTMTRRVMRPGVAKISIDGKTARFTYPDGRVRHLHDVIATEKTITGAYKRLFDTWRMSINRMTGDVEVRSGGTIDFIGVCAPAEPEPVTRKF